MVAVRCRICSLHSRRCFCRFSIMSWSSKSSLTSGGGRSSVHRRNSVRRCMLLVFTTIDAFTADVDARRYPRLSSLSMALSRSSSCSCSCSCSCLSSLASGLSWEPFSSGTPPLARMSDSFISGRPESAESLRASRSMDSSSAPSGSSPSKVSSSLPGILKRTWRPLSSTPESLVSPASAPLCFTDRNAGTSTRATGALGVSSDAASSMASSPNDKLDLRVSSRYCFCSSVRFSVLPVKYSSVCCDVTELFGLPEVRE
mmetsp:Transcript_8214/g.30863  ORF Transcript_8214/g.30863 Transcript_8214/m.30863 type:complete len:258 (-) Transcript_8214:327-1100(-)